MTARRLLFVSACLSFSSGGAFAADAADPRGGALSSLRGVGSVQTLFVGEVVAPPRPVVTSFAPGLPQDGGTNLHGLLRDPRANAPTPAGVRLVDPGWMRQSPSERR